jgi:hypothetical protein
MVASRSNGNLVVVIDASIQSFLATRRCGHRAAHVVIFRPGSAYGIICECRIILGARARYARCSRFRKTSVAVHFGAILELPEFIKAGGPPAFSSAFGMACMLAQLDDPAKYLILPVYGGGRLGGRWPGALLRAVGLADTRKCAAVIAFLTSLTVLPAQQAATRAPHLPARGRKTCRLGHTDPHSAKSRESNGGHR